MQELSGIALIAAGALLLVVSRRACSMAGEAWFTSDTFVMSVVGPVFILSLAGGAGIILYSSLHGASAAATIVGFASAAGLAALAALAWLKARHWREPAGRAANVVEFTTPHSTSPDGSSNPDAPRPPVAPRSRKAA